MYLSRFPHDAHRRSRRHRKKTTLLNGLLRQLQGTIGARARGSNVCRSIVVPAYDQACGENVHTDRTANAEVERWEIAPMAASLALSYATGRAV